MSTENIFPPIPLQGKLKSYIEDTRSGIATAAFTLPFSGRCYALSKMGGFVLHVVSDHMAAERAKEALSLFLGGKVDIVTAKEEVLLYKKAVSHESVYSQCAALYNIIRKKSVGAVITAEAVTRLFPQRQRFENAILTLSQNKEYDLHVLTKRLVALGYSREEQVSGKGQFSVRGDILDIFPVQEQKPVRLEFFGDTLDQIRIFDEETQVSSQRLELIDIAPATDVLLSQEEISPIEKEMIAEFKSLNIAPTHLARLKGIIEDAVTALKDGSRDTALSYCLPFSSAVGKLSDYLPEGSVVALDEPKQISDRLALLYSEHDSRFENLLENGEILRSHYHQLKNRLTLFKEFEKFNHTTFNNISTSANIFNPENIYTIRSTKTPRYNGNYVELVQDLKNWVVGGYTVLIQGRDGETAKNVVSELYKLGFASEYREKINSSEQTGCYVLPNELYEGVILHDINLVIVGTSDILKAKKTTVLRRSGTSVFTAPEVGDYVVHETHGIGICRGIKRLSVIFEKEYLSIEFKDGDMLYVPCDQMDVLAKYSSGETQPKLSKIGGKEFAVLKERVKKSVREMAIDLKELYLERNKTEGHAFSVDSELQREFEDAFEFEETPDQLKCIVEIKKDMESPKVMDRLLCGDVGYGKTEVALRAAFKAVCDGKQVAILSPTTILSQQHFNLCLKRFEGFGLRMGVLNRFYAPKEQEQTVKKLSEGRIDIISATHRLLSKDISFFDLGLLVVDEEQRFGVEDKEKIKLLKSNVDVLTLSATPIPRTLHLSMSGIRDISILETPPRERLPVQTYVIEYTESLLRDAIMRELSRGGQVFILYNKVESINAFAFKVTRAVPEANVIVAHGQMKEGDLEQAIMKFYAGERNVLVCTTIIENGIDIPNANTLIVVDSDRLGLSQLYQLRGRVGRSNRLAHVYFTYQQDKVLTESAYKRLNSILEFTEFGSGFKIAMRDLEIRGAGSVLGREQHGHMEKVGYDMYIKLLKQSVNELEGKIEQQKVDIDIDIDAFIPDSYISDNSARIRVYQNIAEIESEKDAEQMLLDMRDIYGAVPEKLTNLLKIALVRKFARKLRAESVKVKASGCAITFRDAGILQDASFINAAASHKDDCLMSFSDKPMLIFKNKNKSLQNVFDNIYNFLRLL